MIYLNTPYTQVHTRKLKKYMSAEKLNTGSESIFDAEYVEAHCWQEKRRSSDRRQRSINPLLDLRITRDRREDPDMPSINVVV